MYDIDWHKYEPKNISHSLSHSSHSNCDDIGIFSSSSNMAMRVYGYLLVGLKTYISLVIYWICHWYHAEAKDTSGKKFNSTIISSINMKIHKKWSACKPQPIAELKPNKKKKNHFPWFHSMIALIIILTKWTGFVQIIDRLSF